MGTSVKFGAYVVQRLETYICFLFLKIALMLVLNIPAGNNFVKCILYVELADVMSRCKAHILVTG